MLVVAFGYLRTHLTYRAYKYIHIYVRRSHAKIAHIVRDWEDTRFSVLFEQTRTLVWTIGRSTPYAASIAATAAADAAVVALLLMRNCMFAGMDHVCMYVTWRM